MTPATPPSPVASGAAGGALAELAEELRTVGSDAGLDAVGIAPADPFLGTRKLLEERKAAGLHGGMQFTYRNPARSTDPRRALAGARAIVVGARSYRREPPGAAGRLPAGAPAGAVARYSWIDHYEPLRKGLEQVAKRLCADGWDAVVLVDDNALVDREAAYRAGLGWYGKNSNLLLADRGSWFVLGSVVTTAPLPVNEAPLADGCGACTRCLPACPTGALVAPGVLDARRCLAWLLEAPGPFPPEYRVALGSRIYGCDDCQEVCPPNHLEVRRRPPPAAEPGSEPEVDIVGLLEERDDRELLRRFGRWYVPRRQARYLRRNALVALGNAGDPRSPRVTAALVAALDDPDPLLRGHAAWAAARLGHDHLLHQLLASEADPYVRAELDALPDPR